MPSSPPDAEFARNAADGAREATPRSGRLQGRRQGTYPPTTTDYTPIVRAIQATSPDMVFVGSYPPDTVGMVRAANEVGLKTKVFGGGMVGLQSTSIKAELGPTAATVSVNYDFWIPKIAEDEVRGGVAGPGSSATRRRPRARASTPSAITWRPGPTRISRCWRKRSRPPKASTTTPRLADYIRANDLQDRARRRHLRQQRRACGASPRVVQSSVPRHPRATTSRAVPHHEHPDGGRAADYASGDVSLPLYGSEVAGEPSALRAPR